jgi:hypothetical protein
MGFDCVTLVFFLKRKRYKFKLVRSYLFLCSSFHFFIFEIENMFKPFGKNKQDENDYRKEQLYNALKSKFTSCWFHISKTMISH